ncbi:hypothetical protein [Streptomyces sp. NL15-2K]|uniref:hypothetical protein n=1 Tax=Streptomyces sp. NL15-2K TaxID=376149 RepID=UPI000F576138|nr:MULTISPECIES: hypothetical protein [Actinomycetes]WKX08091.1 hypothetical protein Q4V64_11630 [Kutzneria buriramensis]GCB50454.1 hypothetical protein SNL152K_7798 [Streptomyces sp. NL15-2K]
MTDSVLPPAPNGVGVPGLLSALDSYRLARQTLLGTLGLGQSNRDPLAEFAEHLVAALLGARLAESRVQANYDLISTDGEHVQVKYLANPVSHWPNEHTVRSIPGVDWYALVVYEAFAVTSVLAFPPDLTEICSALGKRHPGQSTSLQFTRRNWWTVRDDVDAFRQLGMRVWFPPFA